MDYSFEGLLSEVLMAPERPMLVVDEARVAGRYGFSEERVVFAGVLAPVSAFVELRLRTEALRARFDTQKRDRALKSKDVFRGRHAPVLRAAVAAAFSASSVCFWATSMPYLLRERTQRQHPAIFDAVNERWINGPETPVVDMISGQMVERHQWVRAGGRLEVVVDRSRQNGLHESLDSRLVVYDLPLNGAPATRNGVAIRLGAGVQRRLWAASERSEVVGDWLLLADLAAALWVRSPVGVERLRGGRLMEGIEEIGTAPGQVLVEELEKH